MTARLTAAALALLTAGAALAQQPAPQPSAREDALDPSPVGAPTDPDTSLFLGDWRDARPRTIYGRLVFRDILTPLEGADPVRPARRGAVLTGMTRISRATLAPGRPAAGRAPAGMREVYYTTEGTGRLTVNGRDHALREGIGFTLTDDFAFSLHATGKTPLAFYVRTEPLVASYRQTGDVTVVDQRTADRRVGAHWTHICGGGPDRLLFCTIAPRTIPQPHAHTFEEVWLAMKGETVLVLGKTMTRMRPGQAYKVPTTGLTAHSNINFGEEPAQFLYLGPTNRSNQPPRVDFAQLDNRPIDPANAPDIDMFTGAWRDAYPRVMHGNLYMRDMLTALRGADGLHPVRKGAVLERAEAVSHAMLEPNATAHRIAGEAKGMQQAFVVTSGTGVIEAGGQRTALAEGMAFILTPDLNFRLTATGDRALTFYVVTERAAPGTPPPFRVIDRRAAPAETRDWWNRERAVLTREDGLTSAAAIIRADLSPNAMARPTSAAPSTEEIWIAMDETELLFGKQLRRLPAGTAFKVPATGITAHAAINIADRPVRFLYLKP